MTTIPRTVAPLDIRAMGPIAAATSGIAPLLMGAGTIQPPPGVPWWAALLAATLGPACSGVLWMLGRAAGAGVVGWLRGRAAERRSIAANELADADPTNDAHARRLLVEAAADEAAANAIDKSTGALTTGEKDN